MRQSLRQAWYRVAIASLGLAVAAGSVQADKAPAKAAAPARATHGEAPATKVADADDEGATAAEEGEAEGDDGKKLAEAEVEAAKKKDGVAAAAGKPTVAAEGPLGPMAPLIPLFTGTFALVAPTKDFVLLFALDTRFQGTFVLQESADPANFPAPGVTQLRPRSVIVLVGGKIYEKFGFATAIGLHPGELVRAPDNAAVLALFMTAAVVPQYLTLQGGLVGVPFGREAANPFFGTRAIERSMAVEHIAPLFDAGLVVSGAGDWWSYGAAVIGGTAGRYLHRDEEPDVAGRLTMRPSKFVSALDGLDLGVSGQVGNQPYTFHGNMVLHPIRSHRAILLDGDTRGRRHKWGADLQYEKGPFGFQAEYLWMKARRERILLPSGDVAESGTIDASPVISKGGYAELGLFVFGSKAKGLELLAKTEYLSWKATEVDPGAAAINPLTVKLYTAGFNWYLHPSARLQLNGMVTQLEREVLPGQMEAPVFSYLDNRTSWALVSQLQFWLK